MSIRAHRVKQPSNICVCPACDMDRLRCVSSGSVEHYPTRCSLGTRRYDSTEMRDVGTKRFVASHCRKRVGCGRGPLYLSKPEVMLRGHVSSGKFKDIKTILGTFLVNRAVQEGVTLPSFELPWFRWRVDRSCESRILASVFYFCDGLDRDT